MKKKNTYWSNPVILVSFIVLMALVTGTIICSLIMLIKAIQCASNGQPHVDDYNLSWALTFFFINTGLYIFVHAGLTIAYFVRRKKYGTDPNIVIKSEGNEDKETVRLRKTFDAEVIEANAPDSGSLRHSYVQEKRNVDEKTYKKFIRFIISTYTLLLLLFVVLIEGIVLLLIVFNQILCIILSGVVLLLLILVICNYFFITPNLMYKKMVNNPLPHSIRIYEDRVEEVDLLASGKELIYICRFDKSKCKEVGNYVFLRTRNEKALIGILIEKETLGEEFTKYILDKMKKDAR